MPTDPARDVVSEATLLVEHLDVLATMDAAGTELTDAWVAVEDGRITHVGSGRSSFRADRRVDGRGLVAIPGLINTHHHFFQTLTRALPAAQNLRIVDWLATNYALWSQIDEQAVHTTACVAISELLLSGCTTSSDHLYVFPKSRDAFAMFEAEVIAARELGFRLQATRGAMDVSLDVGGGPPAELVEDTDAALSAMEEAVSKLHDPAPGAMVRVGLAPCSLTISSERLMIESGELARRLGVTRHTHVAEVLEEQDHCAQVYGCRPVERLEQLGWLDEDVWLAHVVHASESDIGRLARSATAVAHCPSSNMRLGSGIAPTLQMRAAGIPVAIGVDGSASNDGGNLLAEVRQAMLLSRVGSGRGRLMSPREALALGTSGGALALKRDDIGVLEPGRQADIAFYAFAGAAGAGTENDPVAALVLAPPPRATHVMVNGHFAVWDGRLAVDEEPISRAHAELVRRLVRTDR